MTPPLVSTKEMDFLEEDKPIRGQNYVCLSFLSPEEVLANKEVFFFERYLDNYVSRVHELITNLKNKYPEDAEMLDALRENNPQFVSTSALQDDYRIFKSTNSSDLEAQFQHKNDFRTSMRGIKVRGVFDTLREAQNRAEVLKKMGDKFDIYVAQVGCWCPWSPSPDEMENAEYAETHLNTLMKKYKENMTLRDEFFEQRKQEKIESAMKKVAEEKEKAKTTVEVTDALTGEDIWLGRKNEPDSGNDGSI